MKTITRRWLYILLQPLQIAALPALGIFAVAAFAFTVNASAQPVTVTGRIGGMISGYTTNQNFTAECNQMVRSYGLNGTVIADMDKMMSSGTMGMMQSDGMMH